VGIKRVRGSEAIQAVRVSVPKELDLVSTSPQLAVVTFDRLSERSLFATEYRIDFRLCARGACLHALPNFPALRDEPRVPFDKEVDEIVIKRKQCEGCLALSLHQHAIRASKVQSFTNRRAQILHSLHRHNNPSK